MKVHLGLLFNMLLANLFLLLTTGCAQSVQPSKKIAFPYNLVKQIFAENQDPSALRTYKKLGGSLITPYDMEQQVIVSVYQKGASRIVIYSYRSSGTVKQYEVKAVIFIKNMPKGFQLVHGLCRENKMEQPGIVALMKPGLEYSTNIKQAWLYNYTSDLLTEVNPETVDCYNEFFDMTFQPSFIFKNFK